MQNQFGSEERLRSMIREELQREFGTQLREEASRIVASRIEPPASVPEENSRVVHRRRKCDICGLCPIMGILYHCSVCPDYDLCFDCELDYGHNHPLLKIRHPKQLVPKKPSNVYVLSATSKAAEEYKARLVREMPGDKLLVSPGQEFDKVWTMQNTGKTCWPVNTRFTQMEGDRLDSKTVTVGEVEPGKETDIRVRIKAPTKLGRFTTFFRLAYNGPVKFGQNVWVEFTVADPDVSCAWPVEESAMVPEGDEKTKLRVASRLAQISVPEGMERNMMKLLQICETLSPEILLDALVANGNDVTAVINMVYSNQLR